MPLVVPPCGLSPLGLFYPLAAPAPASPAHPLADFFSDETRDVSSLLESDDLVTAHLRFALSTVRRSGPSVVNIGQRFGDIRKITESTAIEVESEARAALKPLVDAGWVRIVTISVEVDVDWWEGTIKWVNLLKGSEEEETKFRPVGSR